jgi:hypothetical protein
MKKKNDEYDRKPCNFPTCKKNVPFYKDFCDEHEKEEEKINFFIERYLRERHNM